jgi:hypothetical protein
MPDDAFKQALSDLANSLQQISLISTTLRRELTANAEHAHALEAATWRATASIRQLRKGGA